MSTDAELLSLQSLAPIVEISYHPVGVDSGYTSNRLSAAIKGFEMHA